MWGARQLELKNGLPVLVFPLNHLHTVEISLFVRMGCRFETQRTNGISHLIEHVLFRGTRTDPNSHKFSSRVESLAGDLTAATYRDFAYFNLSLPPESFSDGLRLFSQMFTQPVMEGFEKEKGVILEELLEDTNEYGENINIVDISRSVLFKGHPLGLKVGGEPDNIERFTLKQVRAHLDRFFCAKNTVLSISGAVPLGLEDKLRRCPLSRLHTGKSVKYKPFKPKDRGRSKFVFHHAHKDVQLAVQINFRGLTEDHPKFLYFVLLSRILGEGISSRLYRAVCEKSGLAYTVDASLDIFADTSLMDIDFLSSPEKALRATRLVLKEINRVRENGVTQAEVNKVKRRGLHMLRSLYDNPFALARWYGVPYLYGKERMIEKVMSELESLDRDEFWKTAQKLFRRSNLWIHILGELDDKSLAKFKELPEILA